jgi:hypothetical protein
MIEKGTETIPVRATEVVSEERNTIFARQAARFPIEEDDRVDARPAARGRDLSRLVADK